MSKPNSGRAKKAQPELPRPGEGGSYTRDPKTGALTRQIAEVPVDLGETLPIDPQIVTTPADKES